MRWMKGRTALAVGGDGTNCEKKTTKSVSKS